jgi:hypothetical protein
LSRAAAIPAAAPPASFSFPRPLIDAWVEAHTDMPKGGSSVRAAHLSGSSEPLLEWALRQAGTGLAVLVGGSRLGLEALARGEATLAGVHMLDPETGVYNLPAIRALAPRRTSSPSTGPAASKVSLLRRATRTASAA